MAHNNRKRKRSREEDKVPPKDLALLFFTISDEEFKKEPKHGNGLIWTCYCSTPRTKTGSGYSNLASHVKDTHPNYGIIYEEAVKAGWKPIRNTGKQYLDAIASKDSEKEGSSSSSLGLSLPSKSSVQLSIDVLVPLKASNIYKWMNWITSKLYPLSFVECSLSRMYSNLKPISRKTLVKYMNLTTVEVEKKIALVLPSKFSIVYDAWTSRSSHFVGTFITFADKCILIAFTLMDMEMDDDEPTFNAEKFMNVIQQQLEFYGKSFDNVVCITGDNCSVNKRLADLINKPMVGCASHRFNLGVNLFLRPHEVLLGKIEQIMTRLRTLKAASKLRTQTEYSTVLRNKTRWSSANDMVQRYILLHQYLDPLDITLSDVLLSPAEHLRIISLAKDLKNLNKTTLKLQKHGITMLETRVLLDHAMRDYPILQTYVSPNADIVKHPHFESGVVKIQRRQEALLSAEEKDAVKCLLLPVIPNNDNDADIGNLSDDDSDDSYSARMESELKRVKQETTDSFKSAYVDTSFIYPVGNDVERLFSQAGRAYDDLRGQLELTNLEAILFLKFNHSFWDSKTVHDAWIHHKSADDDAGME